MCVNFKELNKITVFDPEPMMSPADIFPKLAGSKIKGYYGIPMQEESKDYTTFVCSMGLMRFKVMPYGMVDLGCTYNRMIRKLHYVSHNLESCVDDVLGHTENWSKHTEILRDFSERLKKANLCLRPSKCKIGFEQLKFLGHTLQGDCTKRQNECVGRILNTERSRTKKSCRSLIGIINFYRGYIPNCAEVITPLAELTKNRAPNNVEWGTEQKRSFKEVKKILSSEPILKLTRVGK